MINMYYALDVTVVLETFTDKLLYGGQMLLIGLGMVFAVLIILMLTVLTFKNIFGKMTSGEVNNTLKAEAPIIQTTRANADSDEIVAVIAAAIAMAESENNGLTFRVVSFKRK